MTMFSTPYPAFLTPRYTPTYLRRTALFASFVALALLGGQAEGLASHASATPASNHSCPAQTVDILITPEGASFRTSEDPTYTYLPENKYLEVSKDAELTFRLHDLNTVLVYENNYWIHTEDVTDIDDTFVFSVSNMSTYKFLAMQTGALPAVNVPTTRRVVVKPVDDCVEKPSPHKLPDSTPAAAP